MDGEAFVEMLSASVHEAWVAAQRANGHTSAVSRLTGEEQMVPYAELSEGVKEYDRVTVRAVLAAIHAAGYRLDYALHGRPPG